MLHATNLADLSFHQLRTLQVRLRGRFPVPGELSLDELDAEFRRRDEPPTYLYARVRTCDHCRGDHGWLRSEIAEAERNPLNGARRFCYQTLCPSSGRLLNVFLEVSRTEFNGWKRHELDRTRHLDANPSDRWRDTPPAKRPRQIECVEDMTEPEWIAHNLQAWPDGHPLRRALLRQQPVELTPPPADPPLTLKPLAHQSRFLRRLPRTLVCSCGKPARLMYSRARPYQQPVCRAVRYHAPYYQCVDPAHSFTTEAAKAESRRLAHNQLLRCGKLLTELRRKFPEFYEFDVPPKRRITLPR